MSDFEYAFNQTYPWERGYTVDHAGPTNDGIVLKTLQEMGMWGDFDGDGDVDEVDLRGMTMEQKKEFYRTQYWNRGRWGRIDANAVAWKAYDCHVNMGLRQAGLILQRGLVICGAAIEVDSMVGPITVNAANATNPILLLNAMRQSMKRVYDLILIAHPEYRVYTGRGGWYDRAKA